MAKKLSYERYNWFDGQVRAGRHPNSKKLATWSGTSQKQAQRDIEFMQDRLNAPLTYCAEHRGYKYESGYQLPPVWLDEEEVLALCVAARLAGAIPDRRLKTFLRQFLGKFITFRSASPPSNLQKVEERIPVKNIEYTRVEETVFRQVVGALFEDYAIKINYRTPYSGGITERLIQPLHLLCYMGNWHLIAFCTLRNELRDFVLSRIGEVEPLATRIDIPPGLPPIKEYIRRSFGVITGPPIAEVVLKFNPAVAVRVSEQVWHDEQKMMMDTDGGLTLVFPVSGFEEVAREVLKYGAEVEVLAPERLREMVGQEIKKMAEIY